MRTHPDPTSAVQRWLRSVVGESWSVSVGWPDPSPSAFLVVSTTVASRATVGLVETWSSTVRAVAETQAAALGVLQDITDAAAVLNAGAGYVVDETVPVPFRWVIAHTVVTGPQWLSAEPSPIGRRDQALLRATFKIRLRVP